MNEKDGKILVPMNEEVGRKKALLPCECSEFSFSNIVDTDQKFVSWSLQVILNP